MNVISCGKSEALGKESLRLFFLIKWLTFGLTRWLFLVIYLYACVSDFADQKLEKSRVLIIEVER